MRSRDPLVSRAHQVVAVALRNGVLKWEDCEVCGYDGGPYSRTEAHHDDYSKPLEVRWLCRSCHKKHHNELRRAAVERARAQAKYQTDPLWAAQLVERAVRESAA